MNEDIKLMNQIANDILRLLNGYDTSQEMDFAVVLKILVSMAVNHGESAEDFAKVCYLSHMALTMPVASEELH